MALLPEIRLKIELRLAELDAEREQLHQMLTLMHNTVKTEQPKLADAIKDILTENPPLQLRNIYERLVERGYTFRGKNPPMSVYSAMTRHPEMFEKTEVGWSLNKNDGKADGKVDGKDDGTSDGKDTNKT